jgi:NTE family protein
VPTPRAGANVTLVLGAGGQVGLAFHAGVLSALSEVTGWDPRQASLIVGTSAGSLSGAMLRAGFSAGDMAARAMGEPLSPEGAAIARRIALRPAGSPVPRPPRPRPSGMASFERLARAWRRPWAIRPGTLAAAMLPEGHVPLEPLLGPFGTMFGDDWPVDPLWAVAVDLDRGDRVVFGRAGAPPATVAQAIAASCAVPAFFAPVTIGDRRYVDGGVHSTTNADLAADSPARPDLVIVSAPMAMTRDAATSALERPVRRAIGLRLASEVSRLRRRGFDVVAFQPGTGELAVMSFNSRQPAQIAEICARTREGVIRRLAREDQRARLDALKV